MKFNNIFLKFSKQTIGVLLLILILSSDCITIASYVNHHKIHSYSTKTLKKKDLNKKRERKAGEAEAGDDEFLIEETDNAEVVTKRNVKIKKGMVVSNTIGVFSTIVQNAIEAKFDKTKEVEIAGKKYNCHNFSGFMEVYNDSKNKNTIDETKLEDLNSEGKELIQKQKEDFFKKIKEFNIGAEKCTDTSKESDFPILNSYKNFCKVYSYEVRQLEITNKYIKDLNYELNDNHAAGKDNSSERIAQGSFTYRNWLNVNSYKKIPEFAKNDEMNDQKNEIFLLDKQIAEGANDTFKITMASYYQAKYGKPVEDSLKEITAEEKIINNQQQDRIKVDLAGQAQDCSVTNIKFYSELLLGFREDTKETNFNKCIKKIWPSTTRQNYDPCKADESILETEPVKEKPFDKNDLEPQNLVKRFIKEAKNIMKPSFYSIQFMFKCLVDDATTRKFFKDYTILNESSKNDIMIIKFANSVMTTIMNKLPIISTFYNFVWAAIWYNKSKKQTDIDFRSKYIGKSIGHALLGLIQLVCPLILIVSRKRKLRKSLKSKILKTRIN